MGRARSAKNSSTTWPWTTVPRRSGTRPILSWTGSYHDFTGADRFNFAPYNLLLTPSKRKSMFGSVNVDLTE